MNGILKAIFKKKKPDFELTPEWQQILTQFEESTDNFFLTGNAGTGKSTLIQYFRNHTKKKVAVLAPTGLAAVNIGGQTIHSFFKFPPRMITPDIINRKRSPGRIYSQLDTIIIDEASMIRADVLDGIDLFLRKFGPDGTQPFGGIQMILVGDIFQLPPVVRGEEATYLQLTYASEYFFSANAYRDGQFKVVQLTKIFRQLDEAFITFLNAIRYGEVTGEHLGPLRDRVIPGSADRPRQAVILTTTNRVADRINASRLAQLSLPEFTYEAELEGNFPEKDSYVPAPLELILRKGARVMFVKNGGQWVNGSLGYIHSLDQDEVQVTLDDTGEVVVVPIETWEFVRYQLDDDTNTIQPQVLGSLKQYPLRLAWAITIHKSQGMTFDQVVIDYTQAPFSHGQTYVALSRCRTFEGIYLTKRIVPNDVIVDQRVVSFLQSESSA